MQLNELHDNSDHASVSLKVLLLIFAVVLVGVLGYLVWDAQNTPELVDSNSQPANKTTNVAEDKATYLDTNTGFTFKYPKTAILAGDKTEKGTENLFVEIYDLTTMEDEPFGYDKESLTTLRDDLVSGRTKTAITNFNVRKTLTLSRLEICDVQFTYTADVFDGKNTLFSVSWAANEQEKLAIVKENPSYFTKDTENCGEMSRWKDTGEEDYRKDLAAGTVKLTAGKLDSDFANILLSIAESNPKLKIQQ